MPVWIEHADVEDGSSKRFHLHNDKISYMMEVTHEGDLAHVYFGPRIDKTTLSRRTPEVQRAYTANPNPVCEAYTLDELPQEYPTFGRSDYREPAFHLVQADGGRISHLTYASYEVVQGKPSLQGLPHTHAADGEAQTLVLQLKDEIAKTEVHLSYTIFEGHGIIVRSVQVINQGDDPVVLDRVMSASIDLPDSDFEVVSLSGSWGRERTVKRQPLVSGTVSLESRRGTSSHQMNPFIGLVRADTTDGHGHAYGMNLIYSGNFRAFAEVSQFATTRVGMGVQPFDFRYTLNRGESFQAPEVVLSFGSNGLNAFSQDMHAFYQNHLIRSVWRNRSRPILVNNWEATYFDFDTDKLLAIAKQAADVGIELFVLDDGWFGGRSDDTSSLGDWFVNESKLPGGLQHLAQSINDLGMKFGLWMEPEMVSPNSDLYRRHPDWCLHVANYSRTESRHQLVLDLSRQDVTNWLKERLTALLERASIAYVKWDMNRNLTEVASAVQSSARQQETWHRYIIGLYDVLEHVTTRFPEVLFESCAGGGGRFDPGMLYYMPQTWTSDDTDAVERIEIQFGTTLLYPPSSMGAHVSAVPNHQVGRLTPMTTRGHVAMAGTFGYELDLTTLDKEDLAEVQRQVAFYKKWRTILQYGRLYRLKTVDKHSSDAAWMSVSHDSSAAIVTYVRVLEAPQPPLRRLYLQGLNPEFTYEVKLDTGESLGHFGGLELGNAGLLMPVFMGDFSSKMFVLQKVDGEFYLA